jgi:kumamolisin
MKIRKRTFALMLSFALAVFTEVLWGQSTTDLSSPKKGALIDLGSRRPRPEDAGVVAFSGVELFAPIGAGQAFRNPPAPPSGAETPASLACIYQLVTEPANVLPGCQIADPNLVRPSGGSGYIFIVDPYDDPTAATDLAAFASYYNMPPPKFATVYATGVKPITAPPNWLLEEATATEWAYAMAPNATIILVEAKDPTLLELMKAEDVARSYFTAVNFCIFGQNCPTYYGEISNSWFSAEWAGEVTYDIHFAPPVLQNCQFCYFQNARPMVIFAASGNIAAGSSVFWPSASPWVTSAGGTTINRDSSGMLTGETTWYNPPNNPPYGGGGGGPSAYETIPTWQLPLNYLLKGKRGTPDLSIEANPASGVGVYVSGGWAPGLAGGTSLSAPMLAGITNSAGNFYGAGFVDSNYAPYETYTPENALLYSELNGVVTYPAYFNDIKGAAPCGLTGNYRTRFGWDFCTGVGTPRTLLGK